MKSERVSATPYCNYSLLHILLLDVFYSTIWNLMEYKLLFAVAILCCILTIRCYISYDFHEALLIKLSIVEYNYAYTVECNYDLWLPYDLFLNESVFIAINNLLLLAMVNIFTISGAGWKIAA